MSKSRFLAYVSHEIRTPIGIILHVAEHLERDSNLTDQQRQLLKTLGKNGSLLKRVINEILDLSKVEAGKIDFHLAPCDVHQLVRDSVSDLSYRCEGKNIALRGHIEKNVPQTVLCDEARVKQILFNLLTNALRHTRQGSVSLTLSLDENNKRLLFDVQDTGEGVAERDVARIFESFEQASNVSGASGLGLTLSRELANKMGGELTLKQSVVGMGSWFQFNLPFQEASAPAAKECLINPKDLDFHGRNILVIDDNEDNLTIFDLLLAPTRAHVHLVTSGRAAYEILEKVPVDIILLDLHMPDEDGFAVLAKLRAENFSMPIWACSAFASKDDERRSLEAGFERHIPKPIDSQRLWRHLQQLFEHNSAINGPEL